MGFSIFLKFEFYIIANVPMVLKWSDFFFLCMVLQGPAWVTPLMLNALLRWCLVICLHCVWKCFSKCIWAEKTSILMFSGAFEWFLIYWCLKHHKAYDKASIWCLLSSNALLQMHLHYQTLLYHMSIIWSKVWSKVFQQNCFKPTIPWSSSVFKANPHKL